MKALLEQSFNGQFIRVFGSPERPLFVAADVCRILGIGNPSEALRGLETDEKTTLSNPEGRRGEPGAKVLNVITESGLYALIFKSRKREAKAFQRWVTNEVLPAIRKTGQYATSPTPTIESTLQTLTAAVTELRAELAMLKGSGTGATAQMVMTLPDSEGGGEGEMGNSGRRISDFGKGMAGVYCTIEEYMAGQCVDGLVEMERYGQRVRETARALGYKRQLRDGVVNVYPLTILDRVYQDMARVRGVYTAEKVDSMIQLALFRGAAKEWEGMARELEEVLTSPDSPVCYDARQFCRYNSALGQALGMCLVKWPERYSRRLLKGYTIWKIRAISDFGTRISESNRV
jgi:prophage antirepressor-like protein